MDDDLRSIGDFRLGIYHYGSTDPIREYVGTGDEWQLESVLSVPYFDHSYSVRIDCVFVELLRSSEDRLEEEVEGLCTIIKFGDTMQLREPFRVVVEVNL